MGAGAWSSHTGSGLSGATWRPSRSGGAGTPRDGRPPAGSLSRSFWSLLRTQGAGPGRRGLAVSRA
eukprot:10453213-Alexandrium_andersonii.AAC.1